MINDTENPILLNGIHLKEYINNINTCGFKLGKKIFLDSEFNPEYDTESESESESESDSESKSESESKHETQSESKKLKRSDWDVNNEISSCLNQINKIKKNVDINNNGFFLSNIETTEGIYRNNLNMFDFTETQFREIYSQLPDGVYGDLNEMKTVTDESVRKARDLLNTDFVVSNQLLSTLADKWCKSKMSEKNIQVEPYKINIYVEGGHFKKHVDTPCKNLLGTIVLVIFDNSKGGDLNIECQEKIISYKYNPQAVIKYNCIGFYSDIPHTLTPIVSGVRVTATFKVLSIPNDTCDTSSIFNTAVDDYKQILRSLFKYKNFGILTKFSYSLQPDQLFKGQDHILKQALFQLADEYLVKIVSVPVLEKYVFKDNHDFDDSYYIRNTKKNSIYLLRDQDIKAFIYKDPSLADTSLFTRKINFYSLGPLTKYVYSHVFDKKLSYGNEYDVKLSFEESIYIHFAL